MNALCALPGCHLLEVFRPAPATVGLILALAKRARCRCPSCGRVSRSGHGSYWRRADDLPCFGQRVRLAVRVRRFRCRNPSCPRRTFAQRLPELIAPRARRTRRLARAQAAAAVALGDEAATRLLGRLGMATSATTLLRLVRALPLPPPLTPRVVGVDDWAMKRGLTYGAILVDLERRCVVDLLPDRTADTLALWLRQRPGVEIIARDRSTELARGASLGAPAAVQVADRWHLLANAKAMLERWLAGVHGRLRRLAPLGSKVEEPPGRRLMAYPRTVAEAAAGAASRARWRALYEEVGRRRAAGQSLSAIRRQMGLARATVRRFAHAESFPGRAGRAPCQSILDPHVGWLQEQLAAGKDNASALWRELRERGFGGGPRQVLHWVNQRRLLPSKRTPYCRRPVTPPRGAVDAIAASVLASPKQMAWLFLQPDEVPPSSPEAAALAQAGQDPEVARVTGLTGEFVGLVRAGSLNAGDDQSRADLPARFDDWLERAAACGVAALATFAAGLRQDGAAVRAALTLPWSSGQVEGQVHRLKLLKRQSYGRASFELLRRRVLLAD